MAHRVKIPKSAPRLERDIEKPVVEYAVKCGCLQRKMNGIGYRGWPDRMFITPGGLVFFIEFKRPGVGALSEGQNTVISMLRERGQSVLVCNDIQAGKMHIDIMVRP